MKEVCLLFWTEKRIVLLQFEKIFKKYNRIKLKKVEEEYGTYMSLLHLVFLNSTINRNENNYLFFDKYFNPIKA